MPLIVYKKQNFRSSTKRRVQPFSFFLVETTVASSASKPTEASAASAATTTTVAASAPAGVGGIAVCRKSVGGVWAEDFDGVVIFSGELAVLVQGFADSGRKSFGQDGVISLFFEVG